MQCKKCGKENNENVGVCSECGEKLDDLKEPQQGYGLTETPETVKNLDFKRLIIGIVGLAVAVGLYCGVSFLLNFWFGEKVTSDISADKHPIVYIKKGDLYVVPYGSNKPYLAAQNCETGNGVLISEDGKRMFFGNLKNHGSLSFKKVTSKNTNAELIEQNVSDYKITKNGKFTAFICANDLYLSSVNTLRKVWCDVDEFDISLDQKYLIIRSGDKLYTCKINKTDMPSLVDENIKKIVTDKTEYRKIFYIKNNSLYCKNLSKEPVAILNNISDAYIVNDNLYAEKDNALYLVRGSKITEIAKDVLYSEHYKNEKAFVMVKNSGKRYIVRAKTVYDVSLDEKATQIVFSDNANYMYTIENGEMYKYRIGFKAIADKTLVKNNVDRLEVTKKYIIAYSKKNSVGVYDGHNYYHLSDNCLQCEYKQGVIYFIDNADNKSLLKRFEKGKTREFDSGVCKIDVKRKDYIVYMKKQNKDSKTGDIYKLKGKKTFLMDTEAERIVTTS